MLLARSGGLVRLRESRLYLEQRGDALIWREASRRLLRGSFNCSPLKHSTTHHEKKMLIFNDVTSALRFVRDLEQRVQRLEKGHRCQGCASGGV